MSFAIIAICAYLTSPALPVAGPGVTVRAPQETGRLVYADFETARDNRPVSNRGGLVQLFAYQETPGSPSVFKGGSPGSDAPELVRLSKENPNKAITFEFQLQPPNQYAGVGVEVHGQQLEEGAKPAVDDVSRYKYMTLQLYVTGVPSVTVEFMSTGHGIEMRSGFVQMTFRVSPGFNTYRVPLDSIAQPPRAQVKVKPRDVLKKLTSIKVIAACSQCTATKGTVVIDNIVFQN